MNWLSGIMTALICIALAGVICMQVTKIFWAFKSKGDSLKPRGIEENNDKGGKET